MQIKLVVVVVVYIHIRRGFKMHALSAWNVYCLSYHPRRRSLGSYGVPVPTKSTETITRIRFRITDQSDVVN